ncbi:MAG TPA: D-alanyl-D-alanine carboxypeptidase/D-alanyl-D-alanine-endopeptidase [Chloroflexota bacterium]|jgi:D-alanyl-D-alanine carboxypeptidase/D-alanyl-D-alanine-endopeptidase (penicillin-binding protein 4)
MISPKGRGVLAGLGALIAVCLLPGASAQPSAVGAVAGDRASAMAAGGPEAAPGAQAGLEVLPPEVRAIMDQPLYRFARWSIYVADLATGAPLYDYQGRELVVPGSVTKLFPGAAALDAFGPDYRFETPIYRRGTVDAQGTLQGDLVLVASGDLTMGGRNTPDGHIDFESFDHTYANATGLGTLTPENPLAGLDDLARQVVAAGIRRVSGNVLIDARLFDQMPKDDYVLSPIMINDNLIDLTVRPSDVGEAATVSARPETAAYEVLSAVETVPAGQPLDLAVDSPQPGQIFIHGQIPADTPQALRTFQAADPPAFARTLLIEALGRQGVLVDAAPTGANRAAQLPPSGSYAPAEQVALLRSLPFSENLNLIFHVSMNLDADTLVMLLAAKNDKTTFDDGMAQILAFLRTTPLDTDAVSLGDGRGDARADLFSPYTATQLLRYMATRPDAAAYRNALPLMGEKGTEIDTVAPTSPIRGKTSGKSGTTVVGDLLHQRPVILGRGLAGYTPTASGRELVYSIYVQTVPIADVPALFTPIKDQGTMLEAIYARN